MRMPHAEWYPVRDHPFGRVAVKVHCEVDTPLHHSSSPSWYSRRHRGIVVALAVLAVLVAVAVDAAEPSCLVLVLVRPGVVLAMNGIQLDIASS